MAMTPHTQFDKLPTPRELLGEQLFNDLQTLMFDIHRRGGTRIRKTEHPALIFTTHGGFVVKVDRCLTKVI